jgi:hypothetical protein
MKLQNFCRENKGSNHMEYLGLDESIVTILKCDYRRGLDWWLDLLNTYTHHS